MSISFNEAKSLVDSFSPDSFQYDWDNTGWNIVANTKINGIYICLDVNPETVEKAEANGCNMILSHHPLIFRAVKQIDAFDSIGKTVSMLINKEISLFCGHTAVDNAPWGINMYLAKKLDLKNVKYLEPDNSGMYGCGFIGDIDGDGIDLYSELDKIKEVLQIDSLRVNCSDKDRKIHRMAGCSGAGCDYINLAATMGADLYITGEVKHNFYVENRSIVIVEAGHYDTEKCFIDLSYDYLQSKVDELKYNLLIVKDIDTVRPYFNY